MLSLRFSTRWIFEEEVGGIVGGWPRDGIVGGDGDGTGMKSDGEQVPEMGWAKLLTTRNMSNWCVRRSLRGELT